MSQQGTVVKCISGEVFVTQENMKKQVTTSLKLNRKSVVETGTNSYANASDNPGPESVKQASGVTLFPETKAIVNVKKGYIEEIEIIEGLILVSIARGKKVVTPVAYFGGTAWVYVYSDGRTVVANSRETIYNLKNMRSVTLDVNQQVMITESGIGEPEPMDQRFYQAQKIWENLGTFYGAKMYGQVALKSDALLEASLMALKTIAEKTGQDFEKMKDEAIQQHKSYKEWAQSEAEKCIEESEKIKETDFSITSIIPINQSIKYQGIELKVLSVKRESKNKDFDLLSIQIEARNESKKQVFVFWNEEVRLINENGEEFLVDDYNLETSFMEETQAKGYLFIPVSKQDQKVIIQFGKKSLTKIELELDLSKTIKGGD